MVSKSEMRRHTAQRGHQLVEIICVLDESGSMMSTKADAIGGYNAFLAEQRKLPGKAYMTLALFNSHGTYHNLCESLPVKDAPKLSESTYQPGGSTALLDAVGRAITEARARIARVSARQKPSKVVCCIVTDGGENDSREFTRAAVNALTAQAEKEGWEFIYLGANQNAYAEAGALGIRASNVANAAVGGMGMATAFKTASLYSTASRAFHGKMDDALPTMDWMQASYTANLVGQSAPPVPTNTPAKGDGKDTKKAP